MLNRSTFCLVLWLMSAPAAFSQTVTFTNLLLTPDGSADFGDEEFTDLPFSVGLLPETIPAGVRELVRVGPLTLTLALGQVEMRVELAAGGEAFTSRPVATGQLITATVGDGAIGHFASLAVGAGTTGLAISTPAPDSGVFTLGKSGGPEIRILTFLAKGPRLFADGFESGDVSAWEASCALGGPGCEPVPYCEPWPACDEEPVL